MIKKIAKKAIPKRYHNKVKNFTSYFTNVRQYLQVQKPITAITGYKWSRSRDLIEIDVTYDCNIKCLNCVRSCKQAPSTEQMSTVQIKKFIKESIENNIIWKRIKVLGGEPTMNPHLIEMLNLLINYTKKHSPRTKIELVSNGLGEEVVKVLKKIPKEVHIINTGKKTAKQAFFKFNEAPIDSIMYANANFKNGCPSQKIVGMGLSMYGYYACPVIAGMDRVIGKDVGRKKMPNLKDNMRDQLNSYCRYCGIFGYGSTVKTDKEIMSKFWKREYKKYSKIKPKLKRY